jgi:hypothetical protein
LGFDAREFTPQAVLRMTITASEVRSLKRAEKVLREAVNLAVSDNTILRIIGDVGQELAERRDVAPSSAKALAIRPENVPELAVVECDGGRIRTREMGRGPGVHLSETGWREDKNACLIRATRKTFVDDPQPDPPECFCDPKHVAKIAETEALSVAAPLPKTPADEANVDDPLAPESAPPTADWRPQRQVRTVLSSLADAKTFGRQMSREAKRRRFFEANAKAFLGDGLPWNWSIWKRHFSDFVPILDFIHPLSYLFVAAKALHSVAEDAWSQYLVWMRGCWQGDVAQVLEELRAGQSRLGQAPPDASESDPRRIVTKTITYLTNNANRMKYPEYRRAGLPVTTAWMESLVKEINLRVKGTEMFWNDPTGAEAILQVRAAALSDDNRLHTHLQTRCGSPFTRKPRPRKLSTEKIKG